MSLNWDVTNVKGFKELAYEDVGVVYEDAGGEVRVRRAAESLIFATMFTGINTITEKNVEEFFLRIYMWEKSFGALRFSNGEPKFFTLKEIVPFIGLKTNASPLTKAQFKNNLARSLREMAEREVRLQSGEIKREKVA